MSAALLVIAFGIVAIFAARYGYKRAQNGVRSHGGWYGLGIVAVLFAGLWLAGSSGNESLAYGFGAALMLAIPVLLAVGVSSAIGAAMRRRGSKHE